MYDVQAKIFGLEQYKNLRLNLVTGCTFSLKAALFRVYTLVPSISSTARTIPGIPVS
jgi:hypothetical protein